MFIVICEIFLTVQVTLTCWLDLSKQVTILLWWSVKVPSDNMAAQNI